MKFTRGNKFKILISLILVFAVACGIFISLDQFASAKTESAPPIENVFFYATNSEGKDVLLKVFTKNEFLALGGDTTYYYSSIDALPTAVYTEAKGVSISGLINAVKTGLDADIANQLSFVSGDSLGFRPLDVSSYSSKTYDNLLGSTRYYFPQLFTNYPVTVDNLEAAKTDKVVTEPILATTSYQSRMGLNGLPDYIAANGAPTGAFASLLDADNSLRLCIPQTETELADNVTTTSSYLKWIYSIRLQQATKPAIAATEVAKPTFTVQENAIDSSKIDITISCTTDGASIYYSVYDTEREALYMPQKLYTGPITIDKPSEGSVARFAMQAVKVGCSDTGIITAQYPLAQPTFVADATNNAYGNTNDIEITYNTTNYPDWQAWVNANPVLYMTEKSTSTSASSSMTYTEVPSDKYTVSEGKITISRSIMPDTGYYYHFKFVTTSYQDKTVSQRMWGNPPTVIADTSGNYPNSDIEITFTDDANWREFTSVVVLPGDTTTGGSAISSSHLDRTQPGKMVIKSTANKFTTVGSYNIRLYSNFFNEIIVTQTIADPDACGVSIGSITRTEGDSESTVVVTSPADSTDVAENTVVNLTVTPKAGMQLKAGTLVATYNDGSVNQTLALTAGEGNTYTFTMPAYAVTVTAEFEPTSASVPIWNGTTIDVSWYNTTDTTFEISTPAQLMGLAAIVNGIYNADITTVIGNASYIVPNVGGAAVVDATDLTWIYGADNFKGKTVKLTADLDMGGVYNSESGSWSGPNYMPIGGQYCMTYLDGTTLLSASWNGTFDGQGHTIKNIYCNRYAGSLGFGFGQSIGLIGRMGVSDSDLKDWYAKPMVKNVNVAGYIYGNRSIGGIVGKTGKSNGSVIENCINYANVKNTDSKGVGGIVGSGWNALTIRNCANMGEVYTSYSKEAGGISGSCEAKVFNCYNVGYVGAATSSAAQSLGSNNGGAVWTNCYWLNNSSVSNQAVYGTTTGSTITMMDNAEAMKTADFITALNGDYRAWVADTANVNNGYPILRVMTTDSTTLTSITKEANPTKFSYAEGQTFDPTGLVLWANYSDGTKEKISEYKNYTISKTDALAISDTSITISGTHDGTTYSYEFPITVVANSVDTITVTTQPQNVLYATGEAFNATGLVIKANYANGTSATLAATVYTLTPNTETALTAATDKITVSYTYAEKTVTVDIPITVLDTAAPTAVEGVYQLGSANDLRWFANQVTLGLNTAMNAKLTQDIDVSSIEWIPIGGWQEGFQYSGTFDGNGKTVKITITGTATRRGLFGYIKAGAVIKDVIVEGTVTGGNLTAGVVGVANGATISNCVNKATVTGKGRTAGIVSSAESTTIKDCENYAIINGTSYVGGIVGEMTVTTMVLNCVNNGEVISSGSYTGGIAGYHNSNGEIRLSRNAAAVTGTYDVGGITGRVYRGGGIIKCSNSATIKATSSTNSSSYTLGGIVGYLSGINGAVTVDQCYNSGSVEGALMNIGGIAGITTHDNSKIINSYNTGSVSGSSTFSAATLGGIAGYIQHADGTVKNCYSIGTVSFTNAASTNIAAIIGKATGVTNISNNYYLGTVAVNGIATITTGTDTTTAKTADELKAVASELGTLYVNDTAIANGGYPVLSWQNGEYQVTVNDSITGGTISVDKSTAAAGETVTITVAAEAGKELKAGSLLATYNDGTFNQTLALTAGENNTYIFTMPAYTVTATAEFEGPVVWDGTVDTAWYNTSDTSFTITNAPQLAGLAAIVNGTAVGTEQDSFTGKTIQLGKDIKLDEDNLYTSADVYFQDGSADYSGTFSVPTINAGTNIWTPIGNNINQFKGTFNGNSHKVSGLYTDITATYRGLFGYIGQGATVKNTTVSGVVAGVQYVGGIAAAANGATVENVTNNAVIYASGGAVASGTGTSGAGHVGGIVGLGTGTLDYPLTIKGAVNNGMVTTPNCYKGGRAGGIVGIFDLAGDYATVLECYNNGAVNSYQYAGGIVGGQFSNQVIIKTCYNAGTITGTSSGKTYAGGIAGKSCGPIKDCYNKGNIVSTATSGNVPTRFAGIVGETYGSTAKVTNCYTIGQILSNATIGTSGNIVGSQASAPVNCYYLDTNALSGAGDSTTATVKSETEFKANAMPTALSQYFAADTNNYNNGYPVLAWQNGVTVAYTQALALSFDNTVATVTSSVSEAAKNETVTINISGIAEGKKVQSITVSDGSTTTYPVTELSVNASYSFAMGSNSVTVTVLFENIAAPSQSYAITVNPNLDAIWTVDVASSGLSEGKITAGATVTVTVNRASDAIMSSLNGIIVKDAYQQAVAVNTVSTESGGYNTIKNGVYTFTMPESAVELDLNIAYAELAVYVQQGVDGTPTLVKSYTREEMLALAASNAIYYTGYDKYPTAVIGKAEKGVTLADLLANANVVFDSADTLNLTGVDSYASQITYETLYGAERYYYPNIAATENKDLGKTIFTPTLVIKGYQKRFIEFVEGQDIDDMVCDTLNAYRFVFGQTEAQFNNGAPLNANATTGSFSKCTNVITIIKEDSPIVTVNSNITGGMVTVNKVTALANETVTVTVAPSSGKQLKAGTLVATYNDGSNHQLTVTAGENNTYTFTMPAYDVTVNAEFEDVLNYSFRIAPASNSVVINNNLVVDVYLDNADGLPLYGAQAEIAIDTAKWLFVGTQASDVTVYNSFSAGVEKDANDKANKIKLLYSYQGEGVPANVTDVHLHIARFTLTANAQGSNALDLSNCVVTDNAGNPFTNVVSSNAVITVGSGSGGNKAEIIKTPTQENKVAADVSALVDSTGKAEATVSGDQLTNLVNGIKAAADTAGSFATINVATPSNAKAVQVTIPQTAVAALAKTTKTEVVISTGLGTMTLDSTALGAVTSAAGNNAVAVSIQKVENNTLPAAAQSLVGDNPVFNLNITANNEKVTSFGNGKVTVKLPYTPKAGEDTAKLTVYYIADDGSVKKMDGAKYDTETGAIVFSTDHFSKFAIVEEKVSFTDVASSYWAKEYIDYLAKRSIINGKTSTTFAPKANITRAEFVSILARMSGIDTTQYTTSPFSDVATSNFYAPYIAWAAKVGVTNVSDGKFNPNANITREQMAAMLYRYANEVAGYELLKDNELINFTDTAKTAVYATEAVSALQQAGIINGKTSTLFAPQDFATRAETAKMITLILQNYAK